jgi:hypothetical protein
VCPEGGGEGGGLKLIFCSWNCGLQQHEVLFQVEISIVDRGYFVNIDLSAQVCFVK